MWDFTEKQLKYLSFYWVGCLLWLGLAIYDFATASVTGFTFGYMFAFGYYTLRTIEEIANIRRKNEEDEE